MIWSFYQNGIDILHPEVCWMGGHKHLILEFPGVYAIVAYAYEIFAADHSIARAVLLLFFAGGTVYFYKIVALLTSLNLARLATLIYLLIPLGLFYSRAIQIDFSAMFFVLGMVFHFSVGYTQKRLGHVLVGSLFAVLAFVTKVPYVVPVVFPLAFLIVRSNNWKFVLKSGLFLLLPMLVFSFWWQHSLQVNSSAPEWDFIPTYRKFTESNHWYFGTLDQRLKVANWLVIANRLLSEVIGWLGLSLLGFSLFARNRGLTFFLFWLIGTVVYGFIFFNLNLIHNYYQTPFLVPFAVLIAVGLFKLYELLSSKNAIVGKLATVAVLLVLGASNFNFAETNYYSNQSYLELIGNVIGKNSEPDDLVIISFGKMDPRCPLLLYRARRNGWSIPHQDLSPPLIYKLM
ncbi:MAG: 4-amino-4-deoxy-L-arabinose transferase-like glycosyltransferase [Granulosicoccus sp.]|jgi:4-amino-4-deoxy-L-arabinose transferase-like glycosyltransferase